MLNPGLVCTSNLSFLPIHSLTRICLCRSRLPDSWTSAEHQTYTLLSCKRLQMFHICFHTCYPAKLPSLHGRFTVKKDCSCKQFYDRLILQMDGPLPSFFKPLMWVRKARPCSTLIRPVEKVKVNLPHNHTDLLLTWSCLLKQLFPVDYRTAKLRLPLHVANSHFSWQLLDGIGVGCVIAMYV